jgi:hypothetical protein
MCNSYKTAFLIFKEDFMSIDVTTTAFHQLISETYRAFNLRNKGNIEGACFVLHSVKEGIETMIHHLQHTKQAENNVAGSGN